MAETTPFHQRLSDFLRELEATKNGQATAPLAKLARSLITAPDRGLLLQLIAFAKKTRSIAPGFAKELTAVITVGLIALKDAETHGPKRAASLRAPVSPRPQLKPPKQATTKTAKKR